MKLLILGTSTLMATPSLLAGAIISHGIGQPSVVARTLDKSPINDAVEQFVKLNNELYTGNGAYMESDNQIELCRVLGDYSDLIDCDGALLVWDGIDLGITQIRDNLIGLDKLVYEVILK